MGRRRKDFLGKWSSDPLTRRGVRLEEMPSHQPTEIHIFALIQMIRKLESPGVT